MGSGLIQIVSWGAQDTYLTGKPEITFFKVMYRRHTNFAVEAIENTFNSSANFGKQSYCTVNRNGDLMTKVYLKVTLPEFDVSAIGGGEARMAWCKRIGYHMIKEVKLEIGGQEIDKHYGDYLNLWYELSHETNQERGHGKLVGDDEKINTLTDRQGQVQLFVPFKFFHCNNDGLALPLIALQYHEVRFKIEFRPIEELVVRNDAITNVRSLGLEFVDAVLLINYVYLDSDERKKFAQASHEYLIEELQHTGEESVNSTSHQFRLTFNHPTKEIIWAVHMGRYVSGRSFLAYDPLNAEGMRDLATRRFILQCAHSTATNNGVFVRNVDDSRIVGSVSVGANATLAAVFSALGAQIIGPIEGTTVVTQVGGFATGAPVATDYRVENVTVNDITFEQPLPWEYVSKPTDLLFAGVTLSPLSTAAKGRDIIVYDWNNNGIYLDGSGNPVETGIIQLNGHERFSRQTGNYFNYVVPYECHTHTPADGINVYSFALYPEHHQPSSTCNLSRIDNTILHLTFNNPDKPVTFRDDFLQDANTKIRIYGRNYNVLRVMSGMGGLAYSN